MTGRPAGGSGTVAVSRWPLLVALGLAVSELGIFLGYVPVAVAGLVLFGGSCAGLVHETGYLSSPAGATIGGGTLFVVLGGVLWAVGASALSVRALVVAPSVDGLALRGLSILVAGGLLMGLGAVGPALSVFRQ